MMITTTSFLSLLSLLINTKLRGTHSIQLDIHLPLIANKTSCIYRTTVEANQQLNQLSKSKHTNEQIHFQYLGDDDHHLKIATSNSSTIQIPHITLFLTDFALENEVDGNGNGNGSGSGIGADQINQTLFNELVDTIKTSICKETRKNKQYYYNTEIQKPIHSYSPYAMYQTILDTKMQSISNRIVKNTQQYVNPIQLVPDWVYDIPDKETREKKIRYIQMYGSPNVLDEFDPHVTVGWDDGGNSELRWSILDHMDWKFCDGWINEVRIGIAGDYGTVIGEPLKVFSLKDIMDCDTNRNEIISVQL